MATTTPTTKKTAKSKVAKAAKSAKTSKKAVKKIARMPNGQSVHSSEPTREPNWSPRRIAIVKAMRALKATSEAGARTAADIGKKAGTVDGIDLADKVDLVKIVLDVYRTSELVHNGFAKSTRPENSRELHYYLTATGQKTTFPQKEKKADKVKK